MTGEKRSQEAKKTKNPAALSLSISVSKDKCTPYYATCKLVGVDNFLPPRRTFFMALLRAFWSLPSQRARPPIAATSLAVSSFFFVISPVYHGVLARRDGMLWIWKDSITTKTCSRTSDAPMPITTGSF